MASYGKKSNSVRSEGSWQPYNWTHMSDLPAEVCHFLPITHRSTEIRRSPIMSYHASSFNSSSNLWIVQVQFSGRFSSTPKEEFGCVEFGGYF
ncbi:hypothetical protein TNCV_1806651 [Trichonephila clavipes]|nr:hypothetical protein TNCV_1806651 [Trichonephila clavipes]